MFEFNYYNPVRAIFGIGKVAIAGETAAELGKKALLVNYKTPGHLLPLLERIKASLCKANVEVVEFMHSKKILPLKPWRKESRWQRGPAAIW